MAEKIENLILEHLRALRGGHTRQQSAIDRLSERINTIEKRLELVD